MSKETKQEQLRQLLAASSILTADIQQAVLEAQEGLLDVHKALQQQAAAPSLPACMLRSLREDVAALQRIVDLSQEISQLDLSAGSGSDECWKGRLEVAEHSKRGFALRVSHDAARALPWQVTPITQLLSMPASSHCICAGDCSGQSHRQALQSELRVHAAQHASARRRAGGRVPRLQADQRAVQRRRGRVHCG